MRQTFFLLMAMLVTGTQLFAQRNKDEVAFPDMPMDEDTKMVTYTEVLEVKGVNSDELYDRGKKWFYDYFKNPSEKVIKDNKDERYFKGNVLFRLYQENDEGRKEKIGTIVYDLIIETKDGRYKYTITDIGVKGTSGFGIEKWLELEGEKDSEKYADWLTTIEEEINTVIESMTSFMATGPEKEEGDW